LDAEARAEKVAQKLAREVSMMQQKLYKLKMKEDEKHNERQALKYAMRNYQVALK
jgi:hypothetical protein